MHVLLPPSETKSFGGSGSHLNLLSLVFPELRAQRARLIDVVRDLSLDPAAARAALKVGPARDAEIESNSNLSGSATMPALDRYTGVLYRAMDVAGMTRAERARAERRTLITSALFGLAGGADLIPHYRLSAAANLPGIGTIAAFWKPLLGPILRAVAGPVLDLRSGAYTAFAAVPDALTVRVVTERADGVRRVVSHSNKHAKGVLARAVATSRADLCDASDVVTVARSAGLCAERVGPRSVEIVTD